MDLRRRCVGTRVFFSVLCGMEVRETRTYTPWNPQRPYMEDGKTRSVTGGMIIGERFVGSAIIGLRISANGHHGLELVT